MGLIYFAGGSNLAYVRLVWNQLLCL